MEEDVVVVLLPEVLLNTGGVKAELPTELDVSSDGGADELDGSCADEDVGDGLGVGVGVGVGVCVGVGVGFGVEIGEDEWELLEGGGGEELGAT